MSLSSLRPRNDPESPDVWHVPGETACTLNWIGARGLVRMHEPYPMRYKVTEIECTVIAEGAYGVGKRKTVVRPSQIRKTSHFSSAKNAVFDNAAIIKEKVHIRSMQKTSGSCLFFFKEPISILRMRRITTVEFKYELDPPLADVSDPPFWNFSGETEARLVFRFDGTAKVYTKDGETEKEHDLIGYYMTKGAPGERNQVITLGGIWNPVEDMLFQRILQIAPLITGKLAYGNELHMYFDCQVAGQEPGIRFFNRSGITGFHIMYVDQHTTEMPADIFRRTLDVVSSEDGAELSSESEDETADFLSKDRFVQLKTNVGKMCSNLNGKQFVDYSDGTYSINVYLTLKLEQNDETHEIKGKGVMPLSLASEYVKKFQSDGVLEWENEDFADHRETVILEMENDDVEYLRKTAGKTATLDVIDPVDPNDGAGSAGQVGPVSKKAKISDNDILIEYDFSMDEEEQVLRFEKQMEWLIEEWTSVSK